MINSNQFLKEDIRTGKSKKILFVISEDWYFISHRLFLAKYAISQGFEVSLLTNVTKYQKHIESCGINLINWDIKRRSSNIFTEIKSIMILLKAIKKIHPDIIHAVGLKPILYGAVSAKLRRVHIRIFAFAGLGYVFSSTQCLARLLRPCIILILKVLLKNRYSTLIMQNKDDAKVFIKKNIVKKSQIKIIKGAGVDTEIFSGSINSSKTPIVLLPARLLKDKGVEDFFRTAEILKNQGINARFVIAGREDPSNPEAVDKESLAKLSESNVVEFWGHVDNMANAFKKSSIICLPSFREGLPKALLEAASCEKPIVTYDVPGCREVVINNLNGFLINFRKINELAAAIQTLLLDESLRISMGKAGRDLVLKEFSQEKIAKQTESIWLSKINIPNR